MKISVVIPVYNAERFILRFVRPLFFQTMGDFEALFVDDCSTDLSVAMIEKCCSADKRFVLLRQDRNRGPMLARRVGMEAAKGDFVYFADVDDMLTPDAFENLLKKDADIVFGAYGTIGPGERVKRVSQTLPYGSDVIGLYRAVLRGNVASALWGKIFRRSMLQSYDYEYYDGLKYGEDTAFFLQAAAHAQSFATVDDCVYAYCFEPGSLTNFRTPEQIEAQLRGRAINTDFLRRYPELASDIDINLSKFVVSRLKEGLGAFVIRDIMGESIDSLFSYGALRDNFAFFKSLGMYMMYHYEGVQQLYLHTVRPLRKLLDL